MRFEIFAELAPDRLAGEVARDAAQYDAVRGRFDQLTLATLVVRDDAWTWCSERRPIAVPDPAGRLISTPRHASQEAVQSVLDVVVRRRVGHKDRVAHIEMQHHFTFAVRGDAAETCYLALTGNRIRRCLWTSALEFRCFAITLSTTIVTVTAWQRAVDMFHSSNDDHQHPVFRQQQVREFCVINCKFSPNDFRPANIWMQCIDPCFRKAPCIKRGANRTSGHYFRGQQRTVHSAGQHERRYTVSPAPVGRSHTACHDSRRTLTVKPTLANLDQVE